MTILQSVVLGLVQGVTEFLPISSSGHLVLFQKIFEIQEGNISFDIVLHLATAFALIYFFYDDFLQIIRNPFSKITKLLIIGSIPSFIFGLLFLDLINKVFSSGKTLGIEFIITALVIYFGEKYRGDRNFKSVNYKDATIIGIGQAVAIMPAISRSGLTIASGLFAGLNKEASIKFSFMLALPAILGATMLDFIKGNLSFGLLTSSPFLIGMLTTLIASIISIKYMMNIFSKKSLKPFAIYTFALGIIIIIDQLYSHIIF